MTVTSNVALEGILQKRLPSFRVRKLKLWFEELDLLVLDHMVENLPVRQMRIWLPCVLKQLPQCDPEGPVDNDGDRVVGTYCSAQVQLDLKPLDPAIIKASTVCFMASQTNLKLDRDTNTSHDPL